MSRIIVSYRRSDSQAASGRIVDRLIAHFGDKSVFMDIDNIPFGIDFRPHIKSALAQADVMIAVIGREWLGSDADGRSRLQDDDDPVRVEIEAALQGKHQIIPVLVNGASMPKSVELPASLAEFSFLNAAPVDVGRDFHAHVDRLIQSIDEVLARKSGRPSGGWSPRSTRTKSSARFIAIAAVLPLIAGAATWQTRSLVLPSTAPEPAVTAPTGSSLAASSLSNPAPDQVAAASLTGPQPTLQSADDIQWGFVREVTDIGLLRRFVELNPDSLHRADAEKRIEALSALVPPVAVRGTDDGDWSAAQVSNSYDSYHDYVKAHPQGVHVADARRAAIDLALSEAPPIGAMSRRAVLVDDHTCNSSEIKVLIAGNVSKNIRRSTRCVPRDQIFQDEEVRQSAASAVDQPNEATSPALPSTGKAWTAASPQDQTRIGSLASPSTTSDVGRFDGFWATNVVCDKKGDAPSWSIQFIGKLQNGFFHGQWGIEGKPGASKFDGTVERNGSIQLFQTGIADPNFKSTYGAVRSGTKFSFPYAGRFDGSHGSATRVEGRTCHVNFVKQ